MNPWWIVIALGMFLIGVTKSGFGGGVGLMIVPMTAIAAGHIPALGAEAALGLMLPLLVAGDILAVWQYRKLTSGEAVRKLLPGTFVGVIIGTLLLFWFHEQSEVVGALILIEIGLESIFLVGLHWWCTIRGVRPQLFREPLRSRVTGTFAGASSTLAHAAGPIIAMYLLPLRLDRRIFVGTNAVFFFILNTTKLPAYAFSGQFEKTSVLSSLSFLPLVAAGAVLGLWLNRRLSDRIFSRVVYGITFALGWYVLADGGLRLARWCS
jgi:uncharacterized membrane protein YfcA